MLLVITFYTASFVLSVFYLAYKGDLIYKNIGVLFISFIGHAAGIWVYSLMPSDSSTQYFPHATPVFSGLGTRFSLNIVWYVRSYITGDSMEGTFLFFGIFAYLGSFLWYCLYLNFCKKINIYNRSLFVPAMILMCWPSFLLFSSGMGKDSLCFFFIPLSFLSLLSLADKKNIFLASSILILSFFFLLGLRPYLGIIYLASLFFYLILTRGKKYVFTRALISLLVLLAVFYVARGVLDYQKHLSSYSLSAVTELSMRQQDLQSKGTYFYMPEVGSAILHLFLLPYSFIMNLFFPMFFLATGISGLIASTENFLLAFIFYRIFRWRMLLFDLIRQYKPIKFLLFFFILGMFFIAAINTNLGLSMRQKIMYLPAALLCFSLVYTRVKLTGNFSRNRASSEN